MDGFGIGVCGGVEITTVDGEGEDTCWIGCSMDDSVLFGWLFPDLPWRAGTLTRRVSIILNWSREICIFRLAD